MELDWLRDSIQSKFEVKFRARLGPEAKDDKSVRLLNRVVHWTSEGIKYEAGQRRAELIARDIGLQDSSNVVVTPGVKKQDDSKGRTLGKKEQVVKRRGCRRNRANQEANKTLFFTN